MKEKPILFNGDMVRAILGGQKTQTRRLVKPRFRRWEKGCQVRQNSRGDVTGIEYIDRFSGKGTGRFIKPPYNLGDILYVRETWYYETHYEDTDEAEPDCPSGRHSYRYVYRASNPDHPVILGGWRPSIHMPKEAARIFLEVTNVKVERLQDISDVDAIDEGILNYDGWVTDEYRREFTEAVQNRTAPPLGFTPRQKFRHLWDKCYPEENWEANPWVWVIKFKIKEVQ